MFDLKSELCQKINQLFGQNGIDGRFESLSDFIIITENGEKLPTFKLLLAMQSKFFEALFRQEPDKKTIQLNYDHHCLQKLCHCPFMTDIESHEMSELLKMLEISDFLQMDTVSKLLQVKIHQKINIHNVVKVAKFVDCFASFANLKDKMEQFIRQNVLHLDLKELPRSTLKTILIPKAGWCPHIKDEHGRHLDIVRSDLKVCLSLLKLDDFKNHLSIKDISENTLKRLIHAGQRSWQFQISNAEMILLVNFLKIGALVEIENEFEDEPKEIKTITKTLRLIGQIAGQNVQTERFDIVGMVRRIKVTLSGGILIGFQIELFDNSLHSICMENNHNYETREFIVPEGQHFKDVFINSSSYTLHHVYYKDLVLVTNEGLKFETSNNIDESYQIDCAAESKSSHHSLSRISGSTVIFGQIKQLQTLSFHFDTIDTNDICTASGGIACEKKKVGLHQGFQEEYIESTIHDVSNFVPLVGPYL